MLNVVARIAAPYEAEGGKPPLSVGLFVEAEMVGEAFDDVIRIPRVALRDSNSVFVVDNDNRLQLKLVDVLRVVEEEVYIQGGLQAGDRVCTSSLGNAIPGMRVRVSDTEEVASS